MNNTTLYLLLFNSSISMPVNRKTPNHVFVCDDFTFLWKCLIKKSITINTNRLGKYRVSSGVFLQKFRHNEPWRLYNFSQYFSIHIFFSLHIHWGKKLNGFLNLFINLSFVIVVVVESMNIGQLTPFSCGDSVIQITIS